MVFFYKKEAAFFTPSPMSKKDIDLKVVSKLVLNQLLDDNSSDNAKDFCSRRTYVNTREDFLLWVWGSWYEVLADENKVE